MNKFILIITLLLILGSSHAQEGNRKIDALTSIESKTKWNRLNYILFSSNKESNIFKTRSFLIDKSTGKARFETFLTNNEHLVVLFNYKTKTVNKSFLDGNILEETNTIPINDILKNLFEDTKLIFLPMLICGSDGSNLSINSEKIVNSEKLIEIKFKNILSLNKEPLDGTIYLNNRGEVKEYLLDNSLILVSDIKDIGDGILLPTRFYFKDFPNSSIKFSTVAAFTNIELDKFQNL